MPTSPRVRYKGCGETGRCRRRPLRKRILWCVGEGLSCPPSCQPTDGHCRARQSGHFLETGSLHPPLAALRRFPLPRATARVAPTKGFVPRAKNKIAPGFCQGRCAAPWYHLASRPAHAGGLMKCRYTSALLRARPSEPKTQEALDPAAPEPCSPVRPAPAFTYSGSLGRSANGVLFPSLPL